MLIMLRTFSRAQVANMDQTTITDVGGQVGKAGVEGLRASSKMDENGDDKPPVKWQVSLGK
jgi:hypothetical protein